MNEINYPNYSVLMSVYAKEKPEYLRQSMESMFQQTVTTNDFVLVCDGYLTDGLNAVVDELQCKYGSILHVVRFRQNRGLGLALADGILECKNELIARMDSDDISRSDRCEIQLQEFIRNSELDVCGSHILEFGGTIDVVTSRRVVPLKHKDIANYQRRRSAFNHMTVMYKKSAVLKAGNYEHCPLMEDDMLWVRMLISGAKCWNVDDYLVYVRADAGLIDRRGGFAYLKKYSIGRYKIYQTGYIGIWDFGLTIVGQAIFALVPSRVRMIMFEKLLRE